MIWKNVTQYTKINWKSQIFKKWFDNIKGGICRHKYFSGWELVGCKAGSPSFKAPDSITSQGPTTLKSKWVPHPSGELEKERVCNYGPVSGPPGRASWQGLSLKIPVLQVKGKRWLVLWPHPKVYIPKPHNQGKCCFTPAAMLLEVSQAAAVSLHHLPSQNWRPTKPPKSPLPKATNPCTPHSTTCSAQRDCALQASFPLVTKQWLQILRVVASLLSSRNWFKMQR